MNLGLKDNRVFASAIKRHFVLGSGPPGAGHAKGVYCIAPIESLTSLIKLHQIDRRSAPCGQIGAATQPPELATSPTLKLELLSRASVRS